MCQFVSWMKFWMFYWLEWALFMPSSHLACDGSTEPVSPFPCGAGGGWDICTDSRAPRPLRFGLARSFTNLKIAKSPHRHRAKADPRMGSRGCRDCTATALTLHDFRTISTVSVRIYPGLPPRPHRRNRMMPVDNVNTYAVARSHLRCPKNRTENRRQIYRTASGANVN